jgi:hypothetical protein
MKIRTASGLFLALSITAVLALAARNVAAQDSATSAAQTAPVPLSYGVSQIIQLSQANVSEGTIVNYIHNSGSSYGLDANQIVYLKQQGVSDTVINTMLNQPRPAAPPASYATADSAPTAIVVAQPAAYAPAPASTVYVIPDTQTYNYYGYGYRPYGSRYYYAGYSPVYYGGCYPGLSFSIGFGGGHHGGAYHVAWGGGSRGGYHGGGGWHH